MNAGLANNSGNNGINHVDSLPESISKIIEEVDENDYDEFIYLHDRKDYFGKRRDFEADRDDGTFTQWFNTTMVIFYPKKAYLKLMFRDDELSYEELVRDVASYVSEFHNYTLEDEYNEAFFECVSIVENKARDRDIPRRTVKNITEHEDILIYKRYARFLRSVFVESQQKTFNKIITFTRSVPLEFILNVQFIDEESLLKFFGSSKLTFNFYQDLIQFDENSGLFKIDQILKNQFEISTVQKVHRIFVDSMLNWKENQYSIIFNREQLETILIYLAYASNVRGSESDIATFLFRQPQKLLNFSLLQFLVDLTKQDKLTKNLLKACFKTMTETFCQQLKSKVEKESPNIMKKVKAKVDPKMKLYYLKNERKITFDQGEKMTNDEIDRKFNSLDYYSRERNYDQGLFSGICLKSFKKEQIHM